MIVLPQPPRSLTLWWEGVRVAVSIGDPANGKGIWECLIGDLEDFCSLSHLHVWLIIAIHSRVGVTSLNPSPSPAHCASPLVTRGGIISHSTVYEQQKRSKVGKAWSLKLISENSPAIMLINNQKQFPLMPHQKRSVPLSGKSLECSTFYYKSNIIFSLF